MAPERSNYGDDSFTEQKIADSGILEDLKALGPDLGEDILALLQEVAAKGKPYDDRTMVMERIMKLTASLPQTSQMRQKLSKILVGTMWDSLQHPPQSYYGDKYQYRAADGSYNNAMIPDLGKAGMPYAKSVRSVKAMHGAKPDPGLLFDLLMARPDGKIRENTAGINSMLFYHATVIIHDLFRTNREDSRISDTSSYLDLSPLYGKDQTAQNTVRTFKDGKLKPDTFAEERLLGQPPGTCVLLVMYNRFHNYVVENLAAINEGGRFSQPRQGGSDAKSQEKYQNALLKRENDLFQTARLIVCGLYMNITLHDYIRGITNVHHSTSSWTIEPRIDIKNADGLQAVERGVGNQVSAEFNLLYRFHSAVSERDEKWAAMFFKEIFGDRNPEKIPVAEFVVGALEWEKKIPKEPSERVFGGLTRDPSTGKFDDGAMVQILKESIEDPAGKLFVSVSHGVFNLTFVPSGFQELSAQETSRSTYGQSRFLAYYKLGSATLNEVRRFFGLKEHDTFEEINPDPEISDILRKLYDSPDVVELYPGLFVEDIKKRMDPGSGIGINYTAGRAVLSDAVGFIRGDRFYTVDYTTATMTSWGMAEVQQDYETLGGSVFHRLINRAFPKWFKFNSIYAMQPMYTPKMNQEIYKKFGTIGQYSLDPPAAPPKVTALNTQAAISSFVKDQENFRVAYGTKLPDLIFSDFMICGDVPSNKENHSFMGSRFTTCPGGLGLFSKSIESTMRKVLAREAYKLKDIYQVDMTKDVARVTMVQIHADFLYLPLSTKEGEKGLSEDEMYRNLATLADYIMVDLDHAESWRLRRQARVAQEKLKTATEELVRNTSRSGGFLGNVFGAAPAPAGSLREVGQKLTKDFLGAGNSVEKTAMTLYTTAAGGVASIASMFVQVLDWFLRDENAEHWSAVQKLAADNTPKSYEILKKYILEAARFQATFPAVRACLPKTGDSVQITDDKGQKTSVKAGEIVVANYVDNPIPPTLPYGTNSLPIPPPRPKTNPPPPSQTAAPQDPNSINLDRPIESYTMFGLGPQACVGTSIVIVALTSMIKVSASLKGLRRAPGEQGQIKSVPAPMGNKRFLSDDWSRFQAFPGAWKVHFDEL